MKRLGRWWLVYGIGCSLALTGGARAQTDDGAGSAALAAPVANADPGKMSVADITACMRANVVNRGSLRDVEMLTTDREGKQGKLKFKLFWKPAKDTTTMRSVLRVVEPAEYARAAYLIVSKPEGDDVYLYMPALDRVQHVVGDEGRAIFGTDFTTTDVKQVQALLEAGQVKRLADNKVEERPTFVLETTTDLDRTGYSRIKSYVDQATCTVLKSEFVGAGGTPKKVLEADLASMIAADPWWLILGYRMRDLDAGTRTDLRLSDVYLLERLPEDLFDATSFYRVNP